MTTLRPDQVAQLVRQAGWPNPTIRGEKLHVIMTAVCFAESGGRVEVVNSIGCAGLWQINAPVHRKYDRRRLTTSALYNCQAALEIYKSQGLGAWEAYTNGAYRKFLSAARRGVASASKVVGKPATTGGAATRPAVTYGPKQTPALRAGRARQLAISAETWEPINGLRIIGKSQAGNYSRLVIGSPSFEAGVDTIPHLKFTLVDPWGGLLWRQQTILTQGSRVQYKGMNFRIDGITFSGGPHTTGQLEVTAVDDLAWRLMRLRGARSASGTGAVHWLASECRLAGINPNTYLLGESVPSQSSISRDVPDQSGATGQGQIPSAWTTAVRLAKELGKRFFISERRLVFGSAAFAMRWTSPGPVEVTSANTANRAGLRMLDLPQLSTVSIGDKDSVQQIVFRVPLNRARFFRPGVPLTVHHVTSVAAKKARRFMVTKVVHHLGIDIDGAEITAIVPVELDPEPPTETVSANSGSTSVFSSSGGGVDGQVARFVSLAVQQAGKRYVWGAEASPSSPNPTAFDCCLTGDTPISTVGRGTVPIRDVTTADVVWCWDDGQLVERPVTAAAAQPAQPVWAVWARGGAVCASANHPFLVHRPDGHTEWVRVDQLAVGDLVVQADKLVAGAGFTPTPVTAITYAGVEPTFDLEIDGARNYLAHGLVVHNSELVEWAAGRAGITPRVPDGSANQLAHCRRHNSTVSVGAGINTKGALLFSPGHVAISLGNGKVIEAANPSQGVRQDNARGRSWSAAGRIPGAKGYR